MILLYTLSCVLFLVSLCVANVTFGFVCPPTVPVQGAALPHNPSPIFPADNWWNHNIQSAPVDPNSPTYINFINNGGTRRLHPDFGGEVSPGSTDIYGMPYAIVNSSQPLQAVTFQYWDESDGVDYTTGQGFPFYPIPSEAMTQAHWVEGGAPANVDQRSTSDRHVLMIDCDNEHLYELYNVYYNSSQGQWYAGSGAFFDLNTNDRRPEGWTSADAAGLAIFPGLVRYDEVYDPSVTDIPHAFRVTVRATNGYVYPASHRAGSTTNAPPMGTRLRLKALVNGVDPVTRTNDPNMRKIFRAIQRYGLIVADNGSDMYITGTFDTRWNNDIVNPAFALLTASDFEVIQLGWHPGPSGPPALSSVSANPSTVTGGNSATGTVTLTTPAPGGGISVALSSAPSAISVPASVVVPATQSSASFSISTTAVGTTMVGSISASSNGVVKSTAVTVLPPALTSLLVSPSTVVGGTTVTGTVTLSAPTPAGGALVTLQSSKPATVTPPSSVPIPAGTTSTTFAIPTVKPGKNTTVTLTASYAGLSKTAFLTVKRR
jgi:hypothetical protein